MPGSTTAVAGDRFPARSNTVVLGVQVVVAPVLLVEAEDAELAVPRTTANPVPALAQLRRDRVPPAPKVIEVDT